MIKYFHKLTKDEFEEIQKERMTWAECAQRYPQPVWCGYPDAVQGIMGCWSLMEFYDDGSNWVTGHNYCKDCNCYIK